MHTTAFIIGPDDGSGAGLADLSQEMGLCATMSFSAIKQAEQQTRQTPICFFLFGTETDSDRIGEISQAVHVSRNRQVRFAPMICFTESPGRHLVDTCIKAGFDDIIAPPFSVARVAERLEKQFGRRIIYFETSGYFGPERQHTLSNYTSMPVTPGRDADHRRIEITRSFDAGISILHDHFYRGGEHQTSERTTGAVTAIEDNPRKHTGRSAGTDLLDGARF